MGNDNKITKIFEERFLAMTNRFYFRKNVGQVDKIARIL